MNTIGGQTTQRESQVQSQMRSLEKQTIQLSQQAESLVLRLEKVMSPSAPTPRDAKTEAMASLVPLADELRGITSRLTSASEALDMILDRLEI